MDDKQDQAKILQTLESKVFDKSTVAKLPFEFFNLIAQVVTNPKTADNLDIPLEAENYFKINKTKQAAELFKFLVQTGVSTNEKTFVGAYIDLLIARYKLSFGAFSEYSVRRIQTNDEYGLTNKYKVSNVPSRHYIAFSVDNFVPKLPTGELDFETLKKLESKKHSLAAFFSVMTSIYELSALIKEYFMKITERGIFPVVFKDEMEDLVIDISQQLLFYFGREVYTNLEKKIPLREILPNLRGYYEESTNPQRYRFSANLDQLETSLTETIRIHLDAMEELTKESKEDFYKEFIEVILTMIKTGLQFPNYFYEVTLRDASKLDIADYNVRHVADLHIYDENQNLLKFVYESYGFVIEVNSMRKVLMYTFNNIPLFNRFLALN